MGLIGIHEFPNGYGASIIADGYGSQHGLLELAVLHNGRIVYDTPVTNDVEGWLTAVAAQNLLDKIAALPPRTKSSSLTITWER